MCWGCCNTPCWSGKGLLAGCEEAAPGTATVDDVVMLLGTGGVSLSREAREESSFDLSSFRCGLLLACPQLSPLCCVSLD